MKNILIATGVIAALILSVIGLFSGGAKSPFGGTTADSFDAQGGFEVNATTIIDSSGTYVGPINSSSTLTLTGEANLQNLIYGGATTTVSATTTVGLTAANVCDNAYIEIAPLDVDSATATLPTASALISDCLTADGDRKLVFFRNTTTTDGYAVYFGTTTDELSTGTTWQLNTINIASSTEDLAMRATHFDWIRTTFHRITADLVNILFERFTEQ